MEPKQNDLSPGEYDAPERVDQPKTSNQDYDYPTDADKGFEPLKPDWDESNPIPVYIVERPEIPQKLDHATDRILVTALKSEQLAGSRENRTRLVLRNEGPDPVYIGPTSDVMPAFASRLAINEREEFFSNASMWARCDPTKTATVSIVQEFTVELDTHRV
jgi:hypothetical protein